MDAHLETVNGARGANFLLCNQKWNQSQWWPIRHCGVVWKSTTWCLRVTSKGRHGFGNETNSVTRVTFIQKYEIFPFSNVHIGSQPSRRQCVQSHRKTFPTPDNETNKVINTPLRVHSPHTWRTYCHQKSNFMISLYRNQFFTCISIFLNWSQLGRCTRVKEFPAFLVPALRSGLGITRGTITAGTHSSGVDAIVQTKQLFSTHPFFLPSFHFAVVISQCYRSSAHSRRKSKQRNSTSIFSTLAPMGLFVSCERTECTEIIVAPTDGKCV